MAVKDQTVS